LRKAPTLRGGEFAAKEFVKALWIKGGCIKPVPATLPEAEGMWFDLTSPGPKWLDDTATPPKVRG
jgi:hypothetical protein